MLKVRKEIIDKLNAATDVTPVQESLKAAVLTELMTIPPYLTALFSIAEGNDEPRKLVHSVVVEEMLHMTLAANTLIAIGGTVPILALGTSVRYPSTFPLDVDDGLVVSLASLSTEQTHDVFMAIERPDTTAVLPGESAPLPPVGTPQGYASLGDFYNAVIEALKRLGSGIFAKPRVDRQVAISGWFNYEIDGASDGRVSSFASAQAVLNKIVAQGEGLQIVHDRIDPKDGDKTYAHYFKFGEIYHGKQLIPDKNDVSGWSYTGPDVGLETGRIRTVQKNAALSDYTAGSGAYIAGSAFYGAYCRLLKALDETFNGNPAKLDSAMGIMFELKLLARQVMRFRVSQSAFAAPPFMPDHSRMGPAFDL
ncbi:ferritin-like protein [Trinickia sp. NRRL B-1857]|uniref:ferritin-like domain-containing protein n=1 Tax=Trinickia sp. NRRL B-1857 TaxID=3162879 RepID=UPI003D275DFD